MTKKKLLEAKANLDQAILQNEKRERRRLRHILIDDDNGSYICRYSRSRWEKMLESALVRRKEIHARIERDGHCFSIIDLIGFDIDTFATNEEIVYNLDSNSQADYDLGIVISNYWEYITDDVSGFGPIVELRRLWNKNGSKVGWVDFCANLIEKEYQNYSILILKAFPLEHEGLDSKARTVQKNFVRRQRALKRLYRQKLNLSPFPGKAGLQGWMWKPHPRLEGLISIG
ncbi:hypothetical protein [Rhodomicrobium lacus]|uniref:hypothetical protein n=1 Tax=Rhodomicrobium lacus TaxID=2498452 RepID=UPI0026E2005C|nr:hypothetical protein [Rhodomicrobium lacus]WKW51898.1 hypothetical protein QMO75_05305 [Rhodomicrobium lacus]